MFRNIATAGLVSMTVIGIGCSENASTGIYSRQPN